MTEANRALVDRERRDANLQTMLDERDRTITELERTLHEAQTRVQELERETARLRHDLSLYANAEQVRHRIEDERTTARDAIEAMLEQLQLTTSFEAWRRHRLHVDPSEAHLNDWREQAWQALHGSALPELGSLRKDPDVRWGTPECNDPVYPGDQAELDGHYAPD